MNFPLSPRLAPTSNVRCAICHRAVGPARRHAGCRLDLVASRAPWNAEGRPVGVLARRPSFDWLPLAALALALLLVGGALGVRAWLDARTYHLPLSPFVRTTG